MNEKDRRAILFGGGALASIALVWLVILPWCDHWNETRQHIEQSRQWLEDFQGQTRRLINTDRELEPIVGPAVKKPLANVAASRTQLIKDVTELYGRAGTELKSVQPESVRTLQDLPGVVRLGVQVQSTCAPAQLVKLMAGAKANANLLLLDRVETTASPQGPGAMNVTMVWSTLALQEGRVE